MFTPPESLTWMYRLFGLVMLIVPANSGEVGHSGIVTLLPPKRVQDKPALFG